MAETEDPEPIHGWFELSHAQYLTIPRSALQSMPAEWQARLVECLHQLDEAIDWRPPSGRYWVNLRDGDDRELFDRLADYERGRRRLLHVNQCRCAGCRNRGRGRSPSKQ